MSQLQINFFELRRALMSAYLSQYHFITNGLVLFKSGQFRFAPFRPADPETISKFAKILEDRNQR